MHGCNLGTPEVELRGSKIQDYIYLQDKIPGWPGIRETLIQNKTLITITIIVTTMIRTGPGGVVCDPRHLGAFSQWLATLPQIDRFLNDEQKEGCSQVAAYLVSM